jgi:voltage-gated potassium channel
MGKHGRDKDELQQERETLLAKVQDWLERPMQVLALVWLVLLVVELTAGLSPSLYYLGLLIWALFLLEFLLDFVLAPHKLNFLRGNALVAVSLLVPAVRTLRFARVLRQLGGLRGLRLVRVLGSLNRGIDTLRAGLKRRGFGYFIALTALITVVGAAGMYAFERAPEGEQGFETYGDAIWWTAMLLTSIGSEYWPRSPEGRILALVLAIYGFGIFGYITAAFASIFIGRDAERNKTDGGTEVLRAVHQELKALREELRSKR